MAMSAAKQNLLLFAVVTLAYGAWRWPGDLVWDDSPTVCEHLYARDEGRPITFDDSDFWSRLWRDAFDLHVDGYRPLNWAFRRWAVACFNDPETSTLPFLALNAILVGLLAVVYFRLAQRFTRSGAGALLAVFLLLTSTPILTGLLVLFTGLQALVPLLMCSALLCYFRAVESPRPGPWLVGLLLILILGPWYREFVGLTPLLILFLEAQRGRCLSRISLLTGVCFLHALFPTAIPHLLFLPDLPIRPVFALGQLGGVIGISALKWRILLDLFSILPPTLFLAALLGWIGQALRGQGTAILTTKVSFLAFFFLLTFLPFLKAFTEQVHLAYCLVPAAIFLAASAEALWQAASGSRALRWAGGGLLLVALADMALNAFVVRGVTRECYRVIGQVAEVCRREMPEGSILLGNAHHTRDVKLLCRGRIDCYFTALTSGEFPRWINDRSDLRELLRKAEGKDIFCLDARLPDARDQRGADRAHWVVADGVLPLHSYGKVCRVSFKYPVVDPLKLLLPTRNVAWPGSPDLEFDYYRGPAGGGRWWLRKVAVDYYFYKVLGRDLVGQ
jgi:hypothetical protein